ncbi:hypothetical protein [Nostoc sp.]|uniref:hypothetical protein n=1 Tax=Nostoc sp. TaxID=1180 RepID=UPI002FF77A5B
MVIGLTTSPKFRSLPLCVYVKHNASILQASILSNCGFFGAIVAIAKNVAIKSKLRVGNEARD